MSETSRRALLRGAVSIAPAAVLASCAVAPALAQIEEENSLAAMFRRWAEIDRQIHDLDAQWGDLAATIPEEIQECRVQISRIKVGPDEFRPVYATSWPELERAAVESIGFNFAPKGSAAEAKRNAESRAYWNGKRDEMDAQVRRLARYREEIGLDALGDEMDRLSDYREEIEAQMREAPIATPADVVALVRYAARMAELDVDEAPEMARKAADALERMTQGGARNV